MNMYKIIWGDSETELKLLPDNSVDSIVKDPPYGLSIMDCKWDYQVPNINLWKECLRVLKPGGHLLSFSGSRTYHRMAVVIEDAGFEIRDQIMWVYGTGFPKNHNIGKAIDKLQNIKHPKNTLISENRSLSGGNYTRNKIPVQSVLGKKWDGWGTALKPSHEPIVLARKPLYEKSIARNVLKFGTGGINIDGCRNNNREGIGGFPTNFIHNGLETEWSKYFYCAKISKKDRNEGCEYLDEKQTIGGGGTNNTQDNVCGKYGIVKAKAQNFHPTVKPTKLMQYLVRLVTPKKGTVLDPFMGSGSTGKACTLEGFEFIGIEREIEYINIAKARIKNVKNKNEVRK